MNNFQIMEDHIYKIPLEDLAFAMSLGDAKFVYYRELSGGKSALFTYLRNSGLKIIDDGTFVGHYIVLEVTYSIVIGKKKFLTYDHIHGICDYSDEIPKKYEDTKVFAVDYLPSLRLDRVAEIIEEKEESITD